MPIGIAHFVNSSIKSRTFLTSIILLMLLSFQTFAQDDWTLLKEENGVKVYYQIADCNSSVSDDPLDLINSTIYQILKLKLVNESSDSKSVTFSKVTKADDGDEFETTEIVVGTTLIEDCETSPKITLTQTPNDNYPISVEEFLKAFSITINQ